jgi:hypothetical protein
MRKKVLVHFTTARSVSPLAHALLPSLSPSRVLGVDRVLCAYPETTIACIDQQEGRQGARYVPLAAALMPWPGHT